VLLLTLTRMFVAPYVAELDWLLPEAHPVRIGVFMARVKNSQLELAVLVKSRSAVLIESKIDIMCTTLLVAIDRTWD